MQVPHVSSFENIKADRNALKILGKNVCNIQFIESSHFKYGIYEPREFENPTKKLVLAHSFLYQIFNFPWFINPIFKIGQLINSIDIYHTSYPDATNAVGDSHRGYKQ